MFHLTRLVRPSFRYTRYIIAPVTKRNIRQFHDEFNQNSIVPPIKEATPKLVPTAVASRYQVFKDEDASVILDIDEERERLSGEGDLDDIENETLPDIYAGLNMERELTLLLTHFPVDLMSGYYIRWS